MNKNPQDKKHRKKPMIELADSINRSSVGDLGASSRVGCIWKIITLIIVIIGLFMLSRYYN